MDKIYSVSELTGDLRKRLEKEFWSIRVQGELSGVSAPSSGHFYFALKDEKCLIRCAWFKNRRNANSILPEEGMQVIVDGQISLYQPRGDLQLIITGMQISGEGALRLAFEKLKQKLDAEGLFDAEHKQPIPEIPKTIGLITSPTGAVLHDMMITIQRRFPMLRTILYPVAVQGEHAPDEIVRMFKVAARRNEVDVIVLARGGGSAEDLQAFNTEQVAKAISNCPIPVISAIGHQIDVSISDFVADYSAPTPTGAAEFLTTSGSQLRENIHRLSTRLLDLSQRFLQQRQQALDYHSVRLVRPDERLRLQQQRHHHATQQLVSKIENELKARHVRLNNIVSSLRIHFPVSQISLLRHNIQSCQDTLNRAISTHFSESIKKVDALQRSINILGPLTTLDRGYAIVFNQQGKVVTSPSAVKVGEDLDLQVAKGHIKASAK